MISAFDWIGDFSDDYTSAINRSKSGLSNIFNSLRNIPAALSAGYLADEVERRGIQPRPPLGSGPPTGPYTPSGPDRTPNYGMGPRSPTDPAVLRYQEQQERINRILAELEGLGDPSRYYADPADLEAQARASVAAQYNPIIQGLRQQKRATRRRGERGQEQVGQMFQALSRNLRGEIPEIQEFYEGEEEEFERGRERLDRSIGKQYRNIQAEQEALLRRLGIEAAAPDVFDEQLQDEGFFQELSQEEAQTGREALGEQRRGDVGFTRRGSQIARMEGTQRQADIANQIMEAMAAFDQQIGSQRQAKQAAYTSALGQLQQQMQQDAMQRAQQEFENYISQIQLGRELQQPIPGTEVEPVEPPQSLAGIGPYYSTEGGLSDVEAQEVQDTIRDALSNEAFSQSQAGLRTRTKEEKIAALVDMGRKRGFSEAQIAALVDAGLRTLP